MPLMIGVIRMMSDGMVTVPGCCQVVRMQLEHRMWVQASRHQGGSGLADGVDLTVPRKQLKRLLKQGDRKQYNALLHVFQGTLGTADNGIGEVCSGCGCASPTLMHKLWQRPYVMQRGR